MATFYVKNQQIQGNQIKIMDEDAWHLKNVLRAKKQEKIEICNEDEIRYQTHIVSFEQDAVFCEIEEVLEGTTELQPQVTLFQGLPKADKLETIIQKNVELGIQTIIPVEMERSISKMEPKNMAKKWERWNKIAKEAAMQSGRQRIPCVEQIMKFENIIENISKYDIVLLPYENEKSITLKNALQTYSSQSIPKKIAIIIGPEGGFSEKEVNQLDQMQNVAVVTLGKRILRTETAGMATMAMLTYEFEL